MFGVTCHCQRSATHRISVNRIEIWLLHFKQWKAIKRIHSCIFCVSGDMVIIARQRSYCGHYRHFRQGSPSKSEFRRAHQIILCKMIPTGVIRRFVCSSSQYSTVRFEGNSSSTVPLCAPAIPSKPNYKFGSVSFSLWYSSDEPYQLRESDHTNWGNGFFPVDTGKVLPLSEASI